VETGLKERYPRRQRCAELCPPFFDPRFVLSSSQVSDRAFPILANWRRDYTLETILVELRRDMGSASNRKLPQPAEGTSY
jgi:ubiquitin-conjugating enzyme E2 variant